MGATVAGNRPEASRSIHVQDEDQVTLVGGPNEPLLQECVDDVWIGVKG